jgi:hypothetical protein
MAMSDAPATLADLDALCLTRLDSVLEGTLNKYGAPTLDAREINPRAPHRRFRVQIDPVTGDWSDGTGNEPCQRGNGVVSLVAYITASPPDRAASFVRMLLRRAIAHDGPMTKMDIREYNDIRFAIDLRRKQLGMSMEDLDHVSGVTSGYSSKIICGMRNLGSVSLPSLLGALKLRLTIQPLETGQP